MWGMERAGILLIGGVLIGQLLYGQSAKETILNNFGTQEIITSSTVNGSTISGTEDLDVFSLRNYDYVLEPDLDKDYLKYQVIKLDELDNQSLAIGLITHSLERENRFVEIEAYTAALIKEVISQDKDFVFVHPYERQYFMTKRGEFKYIDNRDIVGERRIVRYLQKGKPITASTFYFAMREKGLIGREISLRAFMSMSIQEKIAALDLGIYSSAKL